MDDLTASYLAGYFERGGACWLYIREKEDAITSAGISVRARDRDPAVPRLLYAQFGGRLRKEDSRFVWQGWNETAASLLTAIQPFLRNGGRRALVKLLLDFHTLMERMRAQRPATRPGRSLTLTAAEREEIGFYLPAQKALKHDLRHGP